MIYRFLHAQSHLLRAVRFDTDDALGRTDSVQERRIDALRFLLPSQ